MRKILVIVCILTTVLNTNAQTTPEKWDLRKCVDYAMKNNISVKQAEVQARIVAIQTKQLELYKYPSASFNTSLGPSFGRSIDPTTNSFTTQQLFSQSYGLQGNVQLYNWGSVKNSIAQSKYNAQAAIADIEKAANDVALNVCIYYLQVLASNENVHIAKLQIQQTEARINDVKKRVEAGALPELNLLELKSQLANDSTNYITSITAFDQNILNIKALLNIDPAKAFEVETPALDKIPLESIADLMPEYVFALAQKNQPLQKGNDLRLKAAEKNVLVANAQKQPAISAGYGLGTTYNNKAVNFLNGNKIGYLDQMDQNFRQNFGLNIQVPIFDNGKNKSNIEQSKQQLLNVQLQKERADLTLKNDIYLAYTNATAAMQKFYAGKKQLENAEKVYDYSVKRFNVDLLGTLDLLINKNNLDKIKLQQLNNQFEYVFRMKLLEFYKGQGLKL